MGDNNTASIPAAVPAIPSTSDGRTAAPIPNNAALGDFLREIGIPVSYT